MTMTDTQLPSEVTYLTFNLDDMEIGEISFLEMELNRQLRDFLVMIAEQLGRPVAVTFNVIVAQFQYARGAVDPETGEKVPPPEFPIPTGPILQTAGLMQLRKTNPDATWEDAARMKLKVEIETSGVDPTKLVAEAQAAAAMPEDPMAIIERAATATFEPPSEPGMMPPSEPTSSGS